MTAIVADLTVGPRPRPATFERQTFATAGTAAICSGAGAATRAVFVTASSPVIAVDDRAPSAAVKAIP
jgi:hypothetical protein